MKKKVTLIYAGHQLDYLFGILTGFYDNNFEITVIDAIRDEAEKLSFPNVKVLKFLDNRKNIKKSYLKFALSWFFYYSRLIFYILTSEKGIIHIEWINKYFSVFEQILLTFLYKFKGNKIVYKVHDIDSNILLNTTGEYDIKLKKSKQFFYNRVDHFIVHNNFVKRNLLRYGVNPNKITVIKHGINNFISYDKFSVTECYDYFNIPQNAKVILFFGNISPYKNLENLIKTFNTLSIKHKDLFLLI